MTLTRKRAFLGMPLAAALVVSLVGWWSHGVLRRTLEARLQGELQTVLNANVAALDIWVSSQSRLAQVLADDPELRQATAAVLAEAGTGPAQRDRRSGRSAPELELQRVIDERLKPSGFGAALLLSTNLQVVAGSQRTRTRMGEVFEYEHASRVREALTQGRPVMITPFKAGFARGPRGRVNPRLYDSGVSAPPQFPGEFRGGGGPRTNRNRGLGGDPAANRLGPVGARPPDGDLNLMEWVVPVTSKEGVNQAALILVQRPEEEFTRVLSVARPGETGETFAFDPAGRLISGSRFDDQLKQLGLLTNAPGVSSPLNLELKDPGRDLTEVPLAESASAARDKLPLMGMVAQAVAGESGSTVTPVRDYRGVPVVGAWRWLPEHEFGVVTKIDAAEAFRPLRVLRWIIFTLVGLLGLATLVMLVSSYRNSVLKRRFNEAQLKARQLGQYTLLERIGEGAMGVVYRADHALLRRDTAVKLLLPNRADSDLIHQFEREVQLTCRLTHPNTIQIYDYGRTDDGIFYYAMELLRGMTLYELIERHGPQPEERVIHFLIQVCESLREAHRSGLIHRDIKPANLFLCERGGVPDTVKVLDFGLVRRLVEGAVREGRVSGPDSRFLGTPDYMAPETIREPGFGDARTDIYAVGAVGYELLAGEPVFSGETPKEVFDQQERIVPEPLSRRVPGGVSPALEALILRCLEKDPEQRPQSMTEVLVALRNCPLATAWTLERRVAWWTRYGVPEHPPESTVGVTVSQKTLKIDFAAREG
ncbi:MAG: serine/threonine protein kinase [Verrucomicrobia bacterium]|nr:serine/threonine protein kinase [Verrucomicrobiota bacterium]